MAGDRLLFLMDDGCMFEEECVLVLVECICTVLNTVK